MGKRGISTVIATVLTVLITAASISVLWMAVQPLMSSSAFLEDPNIAFKIDKKDSFTVYDPANGYLRVRVTRGGDTDKPEVIALKFIIDVDGNSVLRKTYNVMPPNHAVVFHFLIGFNVNLNSVKVIPIYLVEGTEREGETFDLETRIPMNPGALKEGVEGISVVPDQEAPVTDSLVLYYSFDNAYVNGTHVIDQSGLGHRGQLSGDIQFDATDWSSQHAVFDGDSDYISLKDGQRLAGNTDQDRTISFWADFTCPEPASFQSPFGSFENYYVSFLDPCGSATQLWIGFDDNAPLILGGNWYDEISSEKELYTIVFNEGAGEITTYRNGIVADEASGLTIETSPNPNFYIGTSGDGNLVDQNPNTYFKGSLDDLRVYNRTLSSQEIHALHQFAA